MMFRCYQRRLNLLIILVLVSCGTIIGNGFRSDPTTPSYDENPNSRPPAGLNFEVPVEEYVNFPRAQDCGSFTEDSTIAEVDAGRLCITSAFMDCKISKYLYNKKNSDGSRFVSFVSVTTIFPGNCLLHVHTVSDVPPEYIGDVEKECSTLGNSPIPETSCGILY